ncbi:MAG: pyridoxamine 5'-phosphate oxidase family protein [Tunicatimonas sp.]
MSEPTANPDAAIKLKEKVGDLKIAMMTTEVADGHLHSRPMHTSEVESTGIFWFFTSDHSGKIQELQRNNQVNLAYSDPDGDTYISVTGYAELVKDKAKMHDLWNPMLKAWFPDGLDTSDIALLKIVANGAEYWDTSSNAMVHLYGVAKALLTGKSARGDAGEHEELDIR